MTIQERFLLAAAQHPEKAAIYDDAGPTLYGTLSVHAALIAFRLMECTERERVGILLPSCAGFAVSFFGTLLAGKTAFLIDVHQSRAQIAEALADAEIDTLLTSQTFGSIVPETVAHRIDLEAPGIDTSGHRTVPEFPERTEEDIAAIVQSASRRAPSKPVMLSHRALLSSVAATADRLGVEDDAVVISPLPLTGAYGLACTLLMPILTGAQSVGVTRFQPAALLEAIGARKATFLFADPPTLELLAEASKPATASLGSLRQIVSAGAPLGKRLAETVDRLLGRRPLEGYALAEAAGLVALSRPERSQAGGVGPAVDRVELRIAGHGAIEVGGPSVMTGYLNRSEETAAVLSDDGWVQTGEIGRIDSDGLLILAEGDVTD